ncbi:hypothetical protein D1490_04925 [Neisseria gonorrhoeae]
MKKIPPCCTNRCFGAAFCYKLHLKSKPVCKFTIVYPKKGQSYPEPISLVLGQQSPAAQILTDIYNIPAGRLMPRTS